MLDVLRSYLDSPDLPDEPFVRVDTVEFVESAGVVTLSIKDWHEPETWSRWAVTARGMRDFAITEPHGDLLLTARDHVLARQHTDTRQDLSFRGVAESAPKMIGELLTEHRMA